MRKKETNYITSSRKRVDRAAVCSLHHSDDHSSLNTNSLSLPNIQLIFMLACEEHINLLEPEFYI
jgi:hypothetical protein